MKSTLNQAVLILVISIMASLNVFAQKRFDNPKQNRKFVMTKSGPKTTITENWIPMDTMSVEQKREIFEALVQDSRTSVSKETDAEFNRRSQPRKLTAQQVQNFGDTPPTKSRSWDLTTFGSKIFDL